MKQTLHRLWVWCVGIISRPKIRQKQKASREPSIAAESFTPGSGRWHLKKDILDRLDRYFEEMKVLKRHYPEAYRTYKKIGLVVQAPDVLFDTHWPKKLPALGGVTWVLEDQLLKSTAKHRQEESVYPHFAFFRRFETPPVNVQVTNGDVYEMCAFFVDENPPAWAVKKFGTKAGIPFVFYVAVDGQKVTLLRELERTEQIIRPKNGGRPFGIAHRIWRPPQYMLDWYKDHESKPFEEWLQIVFAAAMNVYIQASSDIRVSVKKSSITAAFSVDMLRTPYFFKDRDLYINQKGSRKKIFHIVRTHKRQFKSGGHTYVRSHFRGQRMFKWNGYDVRISMPGKHHVDLLDMDVGAHDKEAFELKNIPAPSGMMDNEEFIDEVAKAIDR